MCGIVGAASTRNVRGILLEGLKRLEYRGYDSAGVCLKQGDGLVRIREVGKVAELKASCDEQAPEGTIGIAHTLGNARKTNRSKCPPPCFRRSSRGCSQWHY